MNKPIDDQEQFAVSDASFDLYYQKFLGPQAEPREENGAIAGLADPAVRANLLGIQLSPLMRNSLMGAGSLAATLAVGFVLTDGANSQLAATAPEQAPQPQPDPAVVDQQSQNNLFDLLPVPTSPESIDEERQSTAPARRSVRETLAERLKQLQAEDEARLRQQQQRIQQMAAIANRNQSANQGLQAMAQRRQAIAQANAANASTTTNQPNQAATPTAPPTVIQAGASPLSVTSVGGETASPQVVAEAQASATQANQANSVSPNQVNQANQASASQLKLDRTVALQGYDLSVFNPNMLDVTNNESSSTVTVGQPSEAAPSEQPQPAAQPTENATAEATSVNRTAINSLHGIQDFVSLPQRLEADDRPNLLPLTQRAALEVANLDYYNQFLIFHLSPQQYQKLWGAKQMQAGSKRIPTYGVIDYQRRIVIVPQTATIARTATPDANNAQ
jgi:hypothetical protein